MKEELTADLHELFKYSQEMDSSKSLDKAGVTRKQTQMKTSPEQNRAKQNKQELQTPFSHKCRHKIVIILFIKTLCTCD